jgi:hypothetical protein
MSSGRNALTARIDALTADFIDSLGREFEGGFELGVIAVVAEVRHPAEVADVEAVVTGRRRPEVEYTPEAEWHHSVWYRCSDNRDWM